MANKVYKDNQPGQSATISKQNDGTSNISTTGGSNSPPAKTNLPADKQADNPGNINFFGSSFSGADIRLVANLYRDNKSGKSQKDSLEEDIDFTQQVIDGYNLVLGQLDTLSVGGPLGSSDSIVVGLQNAVKSLTNQRAKTTVVNSLNPNQIRVAPSLTRQTIQKKIAGYQQYLSTKRTEVNTLNELDYEGYDVVELGTLQTISIQSHREKYAVRALGHSYPKGFTRGARTIAGSMIFTVFHEHALKSLIYAMGNSGTFGEIDPEISSLIPDQLPPIDFTLIFANEYGQISEQRLYGVEFLNDAVTYSIEDIFSEQVINFVCRDVDVLTSRGKVRLSRLQNGGALLEDFNASKLLFNNKEYNKYLDTLNIRRRLRNR